MSRNTRAALVVIAAAAGLLALLVKGGRRASAGNQGAPAGSLANDPYTQSLLEQDIHESGVNRGPVLQSCEITGCDTLGNASGPLTIDILY